MLTPEREAEFRKLIAQGGVKASPFVEELWEELDYTRMLLKDLIEERGAESLEKEIHRQRQLFEDLAGEVNGLMSELSAWRETHMGEAIPPWYQPNQTISPGWQPNTTDIPDLKNMINDGILPPPSSHVLQQWTFKNSDTTNIVK